MMRQVLGLISLLSGLAVTQLGAAAQNPLIEGVWVTERLSEITIANCETGHCGYLSKIIVPEDIYQANKDAIQQLKVEDFLDYNNHDPKLRQRPLLGLQILTLTEEKSPLEYEGEVYNPEDGNTYYGRLEVLDARTVRLTGCGFFNLICKSEDWVRPPSVAQR